MSKLQKSALVIGGRKMTGFAGLVGCLLLALLYGFHHPARAQERRDAVGAPASQSPSAGAAADARPSARDSRAGGERYRIGPGDVLDIRVYNRPQLSREAVRVDGRGLIRMPLIEGEIRAACRTEEEVAADIYARYQKYYRRPHVDVFIKEYNSAPVAVIGAVNSPGRFQLQRRVRLLELISFAGGPSERAGARLQVAHTAGVSSCKPGAAEGTAAEAEVAGEGGGAAADVEGVAGSFEFYTLQDTLRGVDRSNPYVQPGDIVTLPEADQAYVVGNVLRPTAVSLREPVTVTRALAMAGGTLPDTKGGKIRVIRQSPGSTDRTEILVDLRAVEKRQAEDLALQANDIVEVPTASGKRFLRGLFGGVIPAVTQLPVQVIR